MAIYRMINGNLEKIAGASNSLVFSVSIPTQSWTPTGNGGAYIDVPVLGITVNDNPIVSLEIVETDTATTAKNKRSVFIRIAFSCIDRITTSDNSIRIYCLDMNKTPDCEFSILIRK